jgi:hypothetical protein
MECYLHPGYGAGAMCVACSRPICAVCREDVAGHPMCPECVGAHQQRLAEESPEAAAALAAQTAPAEEPVLLCGPKHYLKGALFGFIAAVAGAIVWDKIVFYTHFQIGYIAFVLAAVVAIAVNIGAEGRAGKVLPVIGCLLAGFCIILGNTLLTEDQMRAQVPDVAKQLGSLDPFDRYTRLLLFTMRRIMDPMDWVFVAIGMWEGWVLTRRTPTAQTAAPDTTATSVPTPTGMAPAGAAALVSSDAASVPTPTVGQPTEQEPQPSSDKPW